MARESEEQWVKVLGGIFASEIKLFVPLREF